MNRYALEEFKKEIPSFEPKTLPKVPTKVYKISIFEHVIEILGIVFLLYLLNYTEGLIALSVDGIKVQLLNNNFNDILPFLNISLFMSLAVSIIQLSKRSKTKFTVTLDYVKTIYTGIIMITLAQNDIFTESVITEYGINFLPSLIRILLYIGAIASFFAGTISYIITMNKMKSNSKYKNIIHIELIRV